VPEEDFHLSDQMRFQAHGGKAEAFAGCCRKFEHERYDNPSAVFLKQRSLEAVKQFSARDALPRVRNRKRQADAEHRVTSTLVLYAHPTFFTAPRC